jgi:hypothetical protein
MAIVKTIETNANKAERTVRCICLLNNIIKGLEGTTHNSSVLKESLQSHGSCQTKTNVSGRSFSRSSKGAIDVRNAITACCKEPTAASLSQNQLLWCKITNKCSMAL